MKTTDNSTWRLHDILKKLRASNAGEASKIVFGKVFKIEPTDVVQIYRSVLSLISVVDETEVRIQRMPELNHALFLKSMPTIRKALAVSQWDSAWSGHLQFLTETAIADISYCADALSKDYRESPINEDELKSLKAEIDELFERVLKSSINKKLKQALLDLFEQIRRAISEYQIRGASVLREALTAGLGQLLLNYQEAKENKDDPNMKAIWNILMRLESILSKAMEYKPLLDQFMPLLLGSPTA